MNLRDDQQVSLSVTFTDQVGNPVSPEQVGTLTFSVDDESILIVTDNGDGTALAVTTGTLGTATVTVQNDFDDDGTADFQGSLAFDVVAGDVFAINVAAGEPTSRL